MVKLSKSGLRGNRASIRRPVLQCVPPRSFFLSPGLRWDILLVMAMILLANARPVFASHSSAKLIPQVIRAIEKATRFFQDEYERINVDGLFGLQIGQGQLNETERLLKKPDSQLKRSLENLMDQMTMITREALENNFQEDNIYTEKFLKLLETPFHFERQPQMIDISSIPRRTDEELSFYDENKGDACFARILGSFQEKNGRTSPSCTVTKDCMEYMRKPNASGYFLTHQLLYLIFIQKMGCEGSGILRRFAERPTVRDLERKLCTEIYREAELLSQNGKVRIENQDLFAEQTLLCAPLGFMNFLRPDWMKMLMSWQDPSGCFARTTPLSQNTYKRSASTMRKLLRDNYMSGDCSSHKSGLGYGVLTIYLKFLIGNNMKPSE